MKSASQHRKPVEGVETLFDLHAGAIYGYLLSLSSDPATADDLANETFLRARSPGPIANPA